MAQPAKVYALEHDIVIRSGIRDRMIDDMRKALEDIASWRKVATEQGFSRGSQGAQEHAARALKRFHEAWAKL